MKPVIAIVCDTYTQGAHIYHKAGDKYIQALVRVADVLPIMVPSLAEPLEAQAVLELADGVLLTGAYSNVQRHHYGQDAAPAGENEDPARDGNTLPLIRAIVEAGVPVFGICRGLQEMNVALGGSLYPRLHETEGRMDHREDTEAPIAVQYGPAHKVDLVEGGVLHTILGEKSFMVNSVHGQGIRDLAPALAAEAVAPDGTIEAVSVKNSTTFAVAVQWHPEWKAWENPQSTKLFKAFGQAARLRQEQKR